MLFDTRNGGERLRQQDQSALAEAVTFAQEVGIIPVGARQALQQGARHRDDAEAVNFSMNGVLALQQATYAKEWKSAFGELNADAEIYQGLSYTSSNPGGILMEMRNNIANPAARQALIQSATDSLANEVLPDRTDTYKAMSSVLNISKRRAEDLFTHEGFAEFETDWRHAYTYYSFPMTGNINDATEATNAYMRNEGWGVTPRGVGDSTVLRHTPIWAGIDLTPQQMDAAIRGFYGTALEQDGVRRPYRLMSDERTPDENTWYVQRREPDGSYFSILDEQGKLVRIGFGPSDAAALQRRLTDVGEIQRLLEAQ